MEALGVIEKKPHSKRQSLVRVLRGTKKLLERLMAIQNTPEGQHLLALLQTNNNNSETVQLSINEIEAILFEGLL